MAFVALSFLGARANSSLVGVLKVRGVVGSVILGVRWTEPPRTVGKVTTLTLGRFGGTAFPSGLLAGDLGLVYGVCFAGDRSLGERLEGD
jgi:hypothetical protein